MDLYFKIRTDLAVHASLNPFLKIRTKMAVHGSLFQNSDQNGLVLDFSRSWVWSWVKIQDLIQDLYSERGLGLGLGFLPKT